MELHKDRLLALAGRDALTPISGEFEFVPLRQGQPLHAPMQQIAHVYFFTAGLSSEIASTRADSGLKSDALVMRGWQAYR